ncbi:MAG: MotA/TolQ/ExbB proton channel family protein [Pseudomonadota bacterium]
MNENTLASTVSFSEMFDAGGPVMFILLALSIIALTVILLKLYQFFVIGLSRKKKLYLSLQQWNAGDSNNAIHTIADSKNPIAVVCYSTMSGLNKGGTDISALREETARVGNREMNALNKGMWCLELIATVSPLLGLFGTVLGMIEAFKALQVAGSQVNPAILSGGIWQALMTTAAGLAVAIPVLMMFKWMERRIAYVGEEMEDTVTQLFTRSVQAEQISKEKEQEGISSSDLSPSMSRA